jgi:hypothetical protein
MKIAVVSESPADEAAIKILVDAIVGHETELVSTPRLRPGGWPHVLALLPSIIKALHYHTDAEGVAVVVDSDSSPVHVTTHQADQQSSSGCRLCLLRSCVGASLLKLSPVVNRSPLKTAVGVAVPAIEAWYCCGVNPHVNEASWISKLLGQKISYSKQSLKVEVYGSDQPGLQTETTAAKLASQRLALNMDQLNQLFPSGFGCLLADVRSWT